MEISKAMAVDLLAKITIIENELKAIKKVACGDLFPNKVKKPAKKKTKTNTKIIVEKIDFKAMPYAEYLKTDHWQNFRKRILRIAKYRCKLCGKSDTILDVHHNNYDHLGEEGPWDIVVLCRDCHSKFHDKLSNHAEM